MNTTKIALLAGVALATTCNVVAAQNSPRAMSCTALNAALATGGGLRAALTYAVAQSNGGFGLHMWATAVANDGTVCGVVFSGSDYKSQWLASRVISAQKASTANGLSLSNGGPPPSSGTGGKGFSIGTANLYAAVQGGNGPLYGLQFSNPVDPEVAYDTKAGIPDDPATFGTPRDPMIGRPVGGINVFGGGLALYSGGAKIGAIGVSGDTSCTDHFVAWRTRHKLGLDKFSGVLGPNVLANKDTAHPDNIIYDIGTATTQGAVPISTSGWGHPGCTPATPAPNTLDPVDNN
jgi:hypothetical protein